MITLNAIDWILLGIGAGVVILIWIIVALIRRWKLKKYTIEDVKVLIKDSHDGMSDAVENIRKSHESLGKLYRAMLEIERYND